MPMIYGGFLLIILARHYAKSSLCIPSVALWQIAGRQILLSLTLNDKEAEIRAGQAVFSRSL